MKKILLLATISIALLSKVYAQTSIISTNANAALVMKGNYNPNTYKPSVVIDQKATIIQGLETEINADSLRNYIVKLGSFRNRNSGSDTVSTSRGIGAARRWVYSRFQQISALNENRLIPSYLQFTQTICAATQHRNIFCVLPGSDTTDKSIVLVEGHIDSRCEGLCDTACIARGIEDNATGTALVMELARVMSKYQFKNTIVFAVVIAEEQGLYGAGAFAKYVQDNGIKIKAVLNNDVIGGILCGKTASPPTDCKSEGEVDSTHVRIFSAGTVTSPHKSFARFAKLQYVEEMMPTAQTPMVINIMTPIDRTGRGGDHQPFSDKGMTAVRFTASHEHGNASAGAGYVDRQHSTRDTLGVDTNSDGIIDSFFVSFRYLQRNTIINGLAAAMAATGPKMPTFTLTYDGTDINLNVTSSPVYKKYKINVRRNAANYDLDQIYTFQNATSFKIPNTKKDSTYFVSLASVDSLETESIFTIEQQIKATITSVNTISSSGSGIRFETPKPNPVNAYTTFSIVMQSGVIVNDAYIKIYDVSGKEISKQQIHLAPGINEIDSYFGNTPNGIYECSLVVNNQLVSTQKVTVNR